MKENVNKIFMKNIMEKVKSIKKWINVNILSNRNVLFVICGREGEGVYKPDAITRLWFRF